MVLTPKIASQEEADSILKTLGLIEDKIAVIQARAGEIVRSATERAATEAKPLLEQQKAFIAALEKWSRDNEKAWPGRTLELNFGKLFFRASSGAILIRSVKRTLAKIKTKGWKHLLRMIEEPNKDAMGALTDEQLKEIGCKREKPDYFHYEVFKTEVK